MHAYVQFHTVLIQFLHSVFVQTRSKNKWQAVIDRDCHHLPLLEQKYRIARNFRGVKILRMAYHEEFRG